MWRYCKQLILLVLHLQVYPGDDVRVEAGDKVGFLSRGDHTAVVYDFVPQSPGTLMLARSFRGLLGAPVLGHTYSFDSLTYDIWRFALAVKVDTGRRAYVKLQVWVLDGNHVKGIHVKTSISKNRKKSRKSDLLFY